jgi:hypothetical protein
MARQLCRDSVEVGRGPFDLLSQGAVQLRTSYRARQVFEHLADQGVGEADPAIACRPHQQPCLHRLIHQGQHLRLRQPGDSADQRHLGVIASGRDDLH